MIILFMISLENSWVEIFAEFDGAYGADFREQVSRTIYNDDYEDVK